MLQVATCETDLTPLKEYHQRYKICEFHLKVHSIVREGKRQRFCQQCGRFHDLSEFDGDKRSCRARLQRHNARRRKKTELDNATKPTALPKKPTPGGKVLDPSVIRTNCSPPCDITRCENIWLMICRTVCLQPLNSFTHELQECQQRTRLSAWLLLRRLVALGSDQLTTLGVKAVVLLQAQGSYGQGLSLSWVAEEARRHRGQSLP